jgi:ABC-type glycerol-3-phosphate transport system substrate-binding protein
MTIPGKQYMIELGISDDSTFVPFLFQRGSGYFDENGNVIMDNEAAIQTMLFYIPLACGPDRIADSIGMFSNTEFKAMDDGYMLCYIQPDWRCNTFEQNVPGVAGKMAVMPLPMVKDAPPSASNPPCSTWGGTMIAMTKASKHQDLAWQFLMSLYLDREGAETRYELTDIIPPVRELWTIPGISGKGPMTPETRAYLQKQYHYWSGQHLGDVYTSEANYVPPHYTSSVIVVADIKLSQDVVECANYYTDHYKENAPDHGEAGFESFVRRTMKKNADELRKFVQRSSF